jgi:hypothetical protein
MNGQAGGSNDSKHTFVKTANEDVGAEMMNALWLGRRTR